MIFTGTDHVVIAVADIDRAVDSWSSRFGLALSHRVDQTEAGIGQAFFLLADDTFVELIAPLNETSPLHGVLADRGEGVHVLAMRVDDLDAAVASLQSQNVRLIGVGTAQVFIHPKAANGVMIQLWPKDRPHRWRRNDNGGEASE